MPICKECISEAVVKNGTCFNHRDVLQGEQRLCQNPKKDRCFNEVVVCFYNTVGFLSVSKNNCIDDK
jgi:hypothetical protein